MAGLPAQDIQILQLFGLLIVALLCARFISLPTRYDPLYWFGELARQMAAKVSHPDRPASQQYIAGMLAIVLLVLPFWSIVSFIPLLAAYPWFFELLILYLCFNDNGLNQQLSQIADAVDKGNNHLARQLLSGRVPQSVDKLSGVGLSKTAIELALTTPVSHLITISLAYFAGGAAVALLVRMLLELAKQWPAYAPIFCSFGKPAWWLARLLLFVPAQIWKLLLALQGGPGAMAQVFTPQGQTNSRQLNACIPIGAKVLQLELGGPQMFGDDKIRLPKTGPAVLPQASDIIRAINLSRTAASYYSLLLICLPLLWILVRLYGHQ